MFRWKDIWLSGGVNAFCAGLTGAWGLSYLFKGNTTIGIFELVICALNVVGFVVCLICFRMRIESETRHITTETALSIAEAALSIAETAVAQTVSEEEDKVNPVPKIRESHHEGRLLRLEGEK